ncbi:MAG: hypothetical protein QM747_19395 [Nocardioides sp.]
MRLPTLAALLLATSLTLLAPTVAEAQTRHFPDPAGDGYKGRALDITDLKLANRPHHVRLTVGFRKVTPGDIGVSLKARGRPAYLGVVVSTHYFHHDVNRFAAYPHRRHCAGFHVWWSKRLARVRITIPSHCLAHGNFGAVKAQVITEVGSDADYLPSPTGPLLHQHFGFTDWVRRG